jgi:hypothetical protein
MSVSQKNEGFLQGISDRYKEGNEISSLSKPVEINGKIYREIIFNKTMFGKPNKKIAGTLYISENGDLVKDIKLQKQIASTSYYSEVIFDEAYAKSLQRAITAEAEILKEEAEYETVIGVLEILKGEGVEGTDEVANILLGLPSLKRDNNKAIEDFIQKLEEHKQQGENQTLNRAKINELLTYYRDILIKNFKRVKFINKQKENYNKISEEVSKRRKNIKTRLFDKQTRYMLNKIDHTLTHLQKILTTYDSVLNMSEAEYIKFLDKMDEEKIKSRLEVTR